MPKAIAPNATKAKVDTKASATVDEPSTSASSSPVQRQQHHPLSLAVRGRQTMEKIVTALMIINGACFGLTMMMWWKILALTGYRRWLHEKCIMI